MSNQITPNPSVPSQVVQEGRWPKVVNNLGIIPTSYKDSMSYYECLAWLCKYLEETVIPTLNQNGEAVEELQGLYIELNSYVTHYFDTLDVQEEINNKLDEMLENGELQTLVNTRFNYLQDEIQSVASGSPAGVYATESDLTTADPNHSKIYVVTANGKWYYYNTSSSEWTQGGDYQSSSDTLRVDLNQQLLATNGVTLSAPLNGAGTQSLNFYLRGGKTYTISRIAPNTTAVRGSIYITGHTDETCAIPYYGLTETFTPTYSGILRYNNATATENETMVFRIEGDIDEINEDITNLENYCFGKHITSTGATGLYAEQNDTIKIVVKSNTSVVNFFVMPYDANTNYVTIGTGSGIYYYKPNKSGYLNFQNVETSLDCTIYNMKGIIKELDLPKTYYVDKSGSGDFTTFTGMLTALENDRSEKIVYVKNGTYDIFEEIGGTDYLATITNPSTTNWRDVNHIVPENTHIIGIGEVILDFSPTAQEIGSQDMAFLFSPLNVSGTCTIENITVTATNCRYAIHDESSGLSKYANSIHKYINVKATKTSGTYGLPQCFGSGMAKNCYWIFESCTFMSDVSNIWTCHTTTTSQNDVSKFYFNNCIFANTDETGKSTSNTINFISGIADSHQGVKNIVNINSCYFTGKIAMTGDAGATQRYQITTLKTTSQGFYVQSDITNNYTPVAYN